MNDYPQNAEAEAYVVGAVLAAGRFPDDLEATVSAEDFDDWKLAAVYEAALALSLDGKPCTVAAVHANLPPQTIRALDNGLRLPQLVGDAPLAGSATYYGQIVAATATRRRYMQAAFRIRNAALEGVDDLDDIARAAIDSVPRATGETMVDRYDILGQIMAPVQEAPGIKYGFPDMDADLPPMRPGEMTVIGARSGVGKSTLAMDIARHAAYRQGKRVLFLSLEMNVVQLFKRVLSAEAKVSFNALNRGLDHVHPTKHAAVHEAMAYVGDGPLEIRHLDRAHLADIRRHVRDYKPDITIVDYIGRMELPRADRHDLSLSAVSKGLSQIGHTEGCHMIVLSQLNRRSAGGKPTNNDLRDSAGLEHDADVIMLGHRPDKEDPDDRPGEVDWHVTKSRHGKSDFTIALAAQLHYSRFASMVQEYPTADAPVVDITEPIHHHDEAMA